jgi:hypothetical protein
MKITKFKIRLSKARNAPQRVPRLDGRNFAAVAFDQ